MNIISIADLSKKQINALLKNATDIKKNPKKYNSKLKQKVLLTFFEMPSLRTMVSFDMAMYKMGGEIIDYHAENSPWGAGKESIEDVASVLSRYVDAVMIRMHSHKEFVKFAQKSRVPVINGLTSYEHPCQILSDLQTINEEWTQFEGLKLAYLGDANNNVTHSLMYACAIMGINMSIACPNKYDYSPDPKVLKRAKQLAKKSGATLEITTHPSKAAEGAHVIYTDSWMSYRIPKNEKERRTRDLKKFQVNSNIMKVADPDAIFMHCLPATRGNEVTKSVIDGKQSVVFDQAENRMHMEKAILLKLL